MFGWLRIARKWLWSFTKDEWSLKDYPIKLRRNSPYDTGLKWRAQILRWPAICGLGRTKREARADLQTCFNTAASGMKNRGEPLPRPGSKVTIRYAPTDKIDSFKQEWVDEFIENILDLTPADVFLSDESTLEDFTTTPAHLSLLVDKINLYYSSAIELDDPMLVTEILARIHQKN